MVVLVAGAGVAAGFVVEVLGALAGVVLVVLAGADVLRDDLLAGAVVDLGAGFVVAIVPSTADPVGLDSARDVADARAAASCLRRASTCCR